MEGRILGAHSGFRIGFDIGGTFTDLVLLSPTDSVLASAKVLTTNDDLATGAVFAIRSLLTRASIAPCDVSTLIHATTQTSNALIEHSGARLALLTTRGFRDILEFGREARYDLYDLFIKPVEPLVPRSLRFEVDERLAANGAVIEPLNEKKVRALVPHLLDLDVQAVTVCLLHSYRNPSHEHRVRDVLRSAGFSNEIVLSCETCPEIREFERMSTTVTNAYLAPTTSRYLRRLSDQLGATRLTAPLNLMSSAGGRLSVAVATRRPVELLESGAAAGVLASAVVARNVNWPKALSFEMGGTTAKVALIIDGEPALTRSYEVARMARFKKGSGIPIQSTAVDLIEVGAGGGSIAKVNRLGLIEVGPESAGSDPGPACYERHGLLPTVTDADLLLGYINPHGLLGGEMRLNIEAAREAMKRHIAALTGTDLAQAAAAVHNVVVEAMARAARIHILEHGHDPRHFRMIACGGAGPVHAAAVASKIGIQHLLILPNAGLGAAYGLLDAPPMAIKSRSSLMALDSIEWSMITQLFDELRREAVAELHGESLENLAFAFSCDMRYSGQGHEISVPFHCPPFEKDATKELSDAFLRSYAALYGRTNAGARVEVVSWRVEAKGRTGLGRPPQGSVAVANEAPSSFREAYFGGRFLRSPVHQRTELVCGRRMYGPALIEERETTTVVPEHAVFSVDEFGNLLIEMRPCDGHQ